MLARNAYGTSLGENSYGGLGQPRKNPKAAQPMPAGTGLPGPEASQHGSGMNMSAYSPGRARPVPPPSQGTPFQAYAPQQQAGPNGGAMTPQGERWYSQSSVPAVSQSATGVNGQQFAAPQQAFTQRDALIQRINESRAPMFAGAGTYLGDGAPPPTWGQKPPLDFNTLMGQANDMVAGGWQNPFAVTAPGAPPPPAMRDGGMTQFQWSQNNPGNPLATNQPAQFGGGYSQQSPRPILRHRTDNPAYQQSQFQEQAIPQVQGTVDYGATGNNGHVPDERGQQESPRPGAAPNGGSLVANVASLPFYKSLMVGDTVRTNKHGQYEVFDQSGKPVQVYGNKDQGFKLIGQQAGGRVGNTMWGVTPEGAAENAEKLARVTAEDQQRKSAFQAEADKKIARLRELHAKQAKAVRKNPNAFNTPWIDEYRELLNWGIHHAYNQGDLSSQQYGMLQGYRGR